MSKPDTVPPQTAAATFVASVHEASLAYSAPDGGGPVTIVDADGGTLLALVPVPDGARLIGWYDPAHLLVATGPRLDVIALAGTVVCSVDMPPASHPERISLGAGAPRSEG